jgi:hypothetical protein
MLSLRGVISAFLQIYGGVGLDHIGCHARPPAKPHESGVYDSGGVGYLSCIRGSRVPSSGEGGGYVTTCTEFYEQRFGAPSHQFLRSLLQLYGLELHHLTPSWILHMAAFVTLCEAYMGIEPHRAWTRKWRCWAVWTSFSYLGLELIPTSTFQCPTLRSGGGKYSSF